MIKESIRESEELKFYVSLELAELYKALFRGEFTYQNIYSFVTYYLKDAIEYKKIDDEWHYGHLVNNWLYYKTGYYIPTAEKILEQDLLSKEKKELLDFFNKTN